VTGKDDVRLLQNFPDATLLADHFRMLVDVTQAFIRETNGSICVVYNPARSPSHGINLPDFEGQYTSMPCDGPSCWEGFYCFFSETA
jgi:hypothetical protein